MSEPEAYRGQKLLLRFDGNKCIHSRHCVLDRPDVFLANVSGPWIKPDDAPAVEDLVATAHNCPSGAITYERLDGGPEEAPPLCNTARVRENGPVAVHAQLQIDGQPAMLRATLCRCGDSKRKPFCDGSHVAARFQASGEAATQPSEPLAQRGGALSITPTLNGPLKVSGNVEVITGTGRTITRSQQVFLCRCGASESKPFCDGTHKKIGFKSE